MKETYSLDNKLHELNHISMIILRHICVQFMEDLFCFTNIFNKNERKVNPIEAGLHWMKMDLFIKILLGFLIGSVIGKMIYFFYTRRKSRILKYIPKETRIEVLRKCSKYDAVEITRKYTTRMVLDKKVPKILLKYNYPDYCNRSYANEDDIIFVMLGFVCDNFKHDSNTRLPDSHSLVGIIRGCEEKDLKTNCRGLSLILAEVLRINGIKARHVTCKPYEEPFSDCHVVVDCLMPSGARIMLDPTYRLYFVDDNGGYISIAQFREGIIEGKDFQPNTNASYNGGTFDYDDYKEYMTKNLVRFNTNYNLDDSKSDSVMSEIELIPKGYSIDGYTKRVKYITNSDYFWNM